MNNLPGFFQAFLALLIKNFYMLICKFGHCSILNEQQTLQRQQQPQQQQVRYASGFVYLEMVIFVRSFIMNNDVKQLSTGHALTLVIIDTLILLCPCYFPYRQRR